MTDTNTTANNKTDTTAPIGGSTFPIATTMTGEFSASAAFDGTNYLVGIEGDANNPNNITAQLVSQSGTLVGSPISVGMTGNSPIVAFDGTNYLMVWEDNIFVYGQFINKQGNLVNTPFQIAFLGDTTELSGIGFGGGNYLVVYDIGLPGSRKRMGRTVSPSGIVGSEIIISTGFACCGFGGAFDGTNFLVVWTDDVNDTEVKGRFVSPAGTLGTEFSINAHTAPSDNPLTVAFDGTNYLVVWTDEVGGFGSGEWDIFGQRIDKSGNLVGSVINISTAPGEQFFPNISLDGTNYLITWTDMRNDANKNFVCDTVEGTCDDIYGQYISKSGTLVGSEFAINTDAGNQLVGAIAFAGGKYLALVNTGVTFDPTGDLLGGDVYGLFITPSLQTRFEENDPAITYTGAWNNFTCTSCSGGALKWANQAGARADFSFNGTGIRWIVTRGMMLGKAKVSLDGVALGLVDLFNPTPQFQLVLQKTGLSPGNHSIGIEISGEKNIDSVNTIIDIDAFEVVP